MNSDQSKKDILFPVPSAGESQVEPTAKSHGASEPLQTLHNNNLIIYEFIHCLT